MGTFGTNNFSNDSALDWFDEFGSRKSIKRLVKLAANFSLDVDTEIFLACCEVVAALSGYPHDELEPDLEDWAHKNRGKFPPEIRTECAAHVSKIRDHSELCALWKETDSFDEWIGVQNDLVRRLESDVVPADAPRAKQWPTCLVYGLQRPIQGRRCKINTALPPLDRDLPGLGTATRVVLSIARGIDAAALADFVAWISKYPAVEAVISDYPRKRGAKVDANNLSLLGKIGRLSIQLETLSDYSFLQCLETTHLEIAFPQLPGFLEHVMKVKTLRKLSIRDAAPACFRKELSRLEVLPSTELFSVTFPCSFTVNQLGQPIQCPVSVERLPTIPSQMKEIVLHGMAIQDPEALSRAKHLRSIDLASIRSELPRMDLSNHEELTRVEFIGIEGVKELPLPENLWSLQLENVHGLQIRLPADVSSIRALRIDRRSIPRELKSFQWLKLEYLSLQGPEAAGVLPDFETAQNLVALTIRDGTQRLPQLTSFSKLKFVEIYNFAGSETVLQVLSTLPELEELELFFDLSYRPSLSVSDYEVFRKHPRLKRLYLNGMFEGTVDGAEIRSALGLAPNVVLNDSGRHRYLMDLEERLKQQTGAAVQKG